ncbi:MAG: efflux RND transporter periplasmic adaptor subunit [Planctomycetaceae bacterium]|nr:efflux RND transporter periplasmic adaptor subunit [Planctomycetaceae bacterium]
MRLFLHCLCLCVLSQSYLLAQLPVNSQPNATAQEDSDEVTQVVIKRDAIHLMNPKEFQISIHLAPVNLLEIRAKLEGVVQNIRVKLGQDVKSQEELIQIDSTYTKKVLERSQAKIKVANLRREIVSKEVAEGKKDQISLDLAEAEIEVAQAELELSKLDVNNTSIRAAFNGQIQLIGTTKGAYVNQGDLILMLADSSQLIVQIPVDREQVKQDDIIEVQLDNQVAKGKVQAILPLTGPWQVLRQIVDTAAIAVVVIDNQGGEYQDGQTVYSPIVPRLPVIEVSNVALKNSETGSRVIQVIRNSVVRDIDVKLLGPLGEGRSYVSGPVQENDELITESSLSLADGTFIRPVTITPSSSKQGKPGAGNNHPNQNSTKSPAF